MFFVLCGFNGNAMLPGCRLNGVVGATLAMCDANHVLGGCAVRCVCFVAFVCGTFRCPPACFSLVPTFPKQKDNFNFSVSIDFEWWW